MAGVFGGGVELRNIDEKSSVVTQAKVALKYIMIYVSECTDFNKYNRLSFLIGVYTFV